MVLRKHNASNGPLTTSRDQVGDPPAPLVPASNLVTALRRDPTERIPVAASVLDSDLLNHAAHLQVFFDWCSFLQRTIKTGPADPGQAFDA